jgi:predicted lipid-binding transport protein (Tim44 family)
VRDRSGFRRKILRQLWRRIDVRTSIARALGSAALLISVASLARTGAGNHAAASHDTGAGGLPFGSGGSLGGIIVLVIIVFGARYFMRRAGSATQPGQAMRAVSPAAQTAISVLGSALGASISSGAGNGVGGTLNARRPLPPAVNAICALDQGFEMESFLQRAEMTFFLVKRGMQNNDTAAIRPYLNDALFGAVSRDIAQSKSQHRHALLESLNIRGLALQEADCSEQGQSLQVHFDLVYRAKVLGESNTVVSDEGEDRRHAERWTFARKASARTPLGGDVTAAKCPACGAELRLGLDGVCAHCKASITNGTVDWVVSDVQPAAFAGYSADSSLGFAAPTVAEGIASLASADKDFAIGPFEARVKTAFLALQDAWCKQHLDAGRAFMSPGAYFSWSAQLETLASEGRRNVMENLEIRSIEPVRVVHGRVFDDLTVRIAAAAADFDVDASGKVVFGDRSVRPFKEDWTFQRSVGVATSNKPGTLENTCPRCGAPLSLTQIGECRFCKAAVTSGKFDWVVSRIDQEDPAEGNATSLDTIGEQLAVQVGGAVVAGLLSSLLSNRR